MVAKTKQRPGVVYLHPLMVEVYMRAGDKPPVWLVHTYHTKQLSDPTDQSFEIYRPSDNLRKVTLSHRVRLI